MTLINKPLLMFAGGAATLGVLTSLTSNSNPAARPPFSIESTPLQIAAGGGATLLGVASLAGATKVLASGRTGHGPATLAGLGAIAGVMAIMGGTIMIGSAIKHGITN